MPARAAAVSPVPSVSPGPSASVAPSPTAGAAGTEPAAAEPAGAEDGADGSGADPEAPVDWQAFVPTDVADHLATMDRAARESDCGVPWQLLAAISRVESDFGRNMATSSAGAVGYGQFLPSSWQAYGNAGNVYDYRDALPAIATYLCQAGLERDPRGGLFAYNHADWYVDLVLELAARYDRLTPGEPTPDVLGVGPAAEQSGVPMRYAPGRDLRRQAGSRAVEASQWLGVPWHGRTPGVAISFATFESTSLAMVRGAFGLTSAVPAPAADSSQDDLTGLADTAWQGGLLPLPIEPPAFHTAADRQPTPAQALLDQLRRQVALGRPVVALLEAGALPGHPPTDAGVDQPVVVVGRTPDGLIVTDPAFSSSLGYGLELKDAEFIQAWETASTPRRALAFTPRPPPLPRDAHLHVAEPPPVYARVVYTPTPGPAPTAPVVDQPPLPNNAPLTVPDPPIEILLQDAPQPLADSSAGSSDPQPLPVAAETPTQRASSNDDDRSWVLVVGAAAFVAGAFGLKRARARRSP